MYKICSQTLLEIFQLLLETLIYARAPEPRYSLPLPPLMGAPVVRIKESLCRHCIGRARPFSASAAITTSPPLTPSHNRRVTRTVSPVYTFPETIVREQCPGGTRVALDRRSRDGGGGEHEDRGARSARTSDSAGHEHNARVLITIKFIGLYYWRPPRRGKLSHNTHR